MPYTIEFAPSATRQFEKLPMQSQVRLRTRIDSLAENPRPTDAKKLSGKEELWRIRSGDYRVVYAIEDQVLVVLVVKVGHRRDVYR